jgi:hypothetical protein
MSIRASAFVAWRADWLCVECWIARHAIGRGVGGCGASAGQGERGRRTRRDDVFAHFFLLIESVKFPDPEPEEGAGGRESNFMFPVSLLRCWGFVEGARMRWNEGITRPVALAELGEQYRRYRLGDPDAEEAMAGSLRRWGQLAPVVACVREERLELIDGFKRLTAARQIRELASLSVRVMEVDEPTAKAAILGLNRDQRPVRELEEAWVVQGLVRDDGMTQVEAAHLLGRHKSWVCRRLALLEKLSVAVKEDLRLGLVGPSLARQLTRLPAGNQQAVLTLVRRETLTAQEVSGVIDLLAGASEEQAAFVLQKPREALSQVHGMPQALRDPRLSRAGNWLAKHLAQALESLVRVENWLRTPNERELRSQDREILQPLLSRVGDQASVVAELVLGPRREKMS